MNRKEKEIKLIWELTVIPHSPYHTFQEYEKAGIPLSNKEVDMIFEGWTLDLFSTQCSRKTSFHRMIGARKWVKVK